MSTSSSDPLREQMQKLVRGRLRDIETARLREQICSDPEAARLYAEIAIEVNSVNQTEEAEASVRPAWKCGIRFAAILLLLLGVVGLWLWWRS